MIMVWCFLGGVGFGVFITYAYDYFNTIKLHDELNRLKAQLYNVKRILP